VTLRTLSQRIRWARPRTLPSATRATEAVLEVPAMRISAGQVADLAPFVPVELRRVAGCGGEEGGPQRLALGDDHPVLVDASHGLGPVHDATAGRRVFRIAIPGRSDHQGLLTHVARFFEFTDDYHASTRPKSRPKNRGLCEKSSEGV
jgi:hypothetical protein